MGLTASGSATSPNGAKCQTVTVAGFRQKRSMCCYTVLQEQSLSLLWLDFYELPMNYLLPLKKFLSILNQQSGCVPIRNDSEYYILIAYSSTETSMQGILMIKIVVRTLPVIKPNDKLCFTIIVILTLIGDYIKLTISLVFIINLLKTEFQVLNTFQ